MARRSPHSFPLLGAAHCGTAAAGGCLHPPPPPPRLPVGRPVSSGPVSLRLRGSQLLREAIHPTPGRASQLQRRAPWRPSARHLPLAALASFSCEPLWRRRQACAAGPCPPPSRPLSSRQGRAASGAAHAALPLRARSLAACFLADRGPGPASSAPSIRGVRPPEGQPVWTPGVGC